MADLRVDEWLPVGWNVEVKFGKNGKKETYYVDPANGYMFRSIKDIDRYLLTGELGRNVVKPNQHGVGSTDENSGIDRSPSRPSGSKKKKSEVLNGSKKLKKPGRNAIGKPVAKSLFLNETGKPKKVDRSSDGKKDYAPFFIGDLAQGGEGQSSSTSYSSATEMAGLLVAQPLNDEAKRNGNMIPSWVSGTDPDGELQNFLLEARSESIFPRCSWLADEYTTEAELFGTVDDFRSSGMLSPLRHSEDLFDVLSAVEDRSTRMVETQAKTVDDPGSPLSFLFGDLCSDPCIDFAVKTLTGSLDPAIEDYSQTQIGSSTSIQENDLYGSHTLPQGEELNRCSVDLLGIEPWHHLS